MKLKLLTIFILTSFYALGQETVLKEKKGESYYVLKDDPKIKHGTFQYSTKKGLVEKGQYYNDKKVGIWEFYDNEGNIEQKYDYTLKQIVFNKETRQFGGYKITIDNKPTDIKPDTIPMFIGGTSRYYRYLQENLKYPKKSKSMGTEGRQLVIISLSNEGEVLTTQIFRTIATDIDEEALRLMNELKNDWTPARHQGKNVSVTFQVPVLFRLN
ncbi:MAG: TonB family protein [Cyclobacteriaceae bacterium]|nr:TonB family protein [Cyclobacteriaceae bacterium]